ncbi:MAG: tetratricopeptide repeat protein [Planctomycetaceae bacterium]|nr:tetratricopeptide repeat protein [Planctomycetaceae bacterium]
MIATRLFNRKSLDFQMVNAMNSHLAIPWILAAIVFLQVGCQQQVKGPNPQSIKKQSAQDDLNEALQYIDALDDFDQEQVIDLTVYYLNRWIAPRSADDQWNRSPLIDSLPRRLKEIRFVGNVSDRKYSYIDVDHIHQCRWLRGISNWISRVDQTAHLKHWNQLIPSSLEAQQREKLILAAKLFDWTIRNIQLDPLLDPSQENLDRSWNLAFEATPGPGYTMTPQETILYGHGDAWQRARIFMLLARQQRIDTVMLSIQRTPDGQPTPWLPAVILNDEVYLFDTQLGLPIMTIESKQLASLKQVRENPAILARLSAENQPAYRVGQEELPQLTALVDASPFAISQRMLMLQKQLTGNKRLTLAVLPDRLGKQLRDKHAINTTKLWNIPFEILLFAEGRERLNQAGTTTPQTTETLYRMQNELFRPELRSPLLTARQRYIHGQFENNTEEKGQSETPGAKPLLMTARKSEKEINGIKEIPELQKALQLQQKPGEPMEAWQERITQAQLYYRAIKQYATYWLGIIQLEEGNYQTAITWLQHAIDEGAGNPFFQGAHYNLGRCHEALGQVAEARKMYAFADSVQHAGNQLRSRLLDQPDTETPRAKENPTP